MDFSKLGVVIKQIRKERNMSLKDVANDIGVSSSLISQIERGIANPSLKTLAAISESLEVPMFSLFFNENKAYAHIIKKTDQAKFVHEDDKIYTIIKNPDLNSELQLYELVIPKGSPNRSKKTAHSGEEVAVVISGRANLIIGENVSELDKGDSVEIESGVPHQWENPSKDEDARIIYAYSQKYRNLKEMADI